MTCLLGIIDLDIQPKHCVTNQTNKIGGNPNWYDGHTPDPPVCRLCGSVESLVVQLYCPLEHSVFHRTLYIFACSRSGCWNKNESWAVYRCQKLDSSIKESDKTINVRDVGDSAGDWGAGADDWGENLDDWGETDDINKISDDWNVSGDHLDHSSEIVVKDPDTLGASYNENNSERTVCDSVTYVKIGDNSSSMEKQLESIDKGNSKSEMTVGSGFDEEVSNLQLQQMCIEDINEKTSTSGLNEHMEHIQVDEIPVLTDEERSRAMKALQDERTTLDGVNKMLQSFFITVIEEPEDYNFKDNHVHRLLKDYEKREGCSTKEMLHDTNSAAGAGFAEKYEKVSLLHKDKVFHKFIKRMSVCPEQLVRYHWNGQPLLISPLTTDAPSVCVHCGQSLVFEIQLTPGLVNQLKFPGENGLAVEFGTVLVFTCSQSCWSDTDTYRTEQVLVQPDPDNHLFK